MTRSLQQARVFHQHYPKEPSQQVCGVGWSSSFPCFCSATRTLGGRGKESFQNSPILLFYHVRVSWPYVLPIVCVCVYVCERTRARVHVCTGMCMHVHYVCMYTHPYLKHSSISISSQCSTPLLRPLSRSSRTSQEKQRL